MIILYLAFVVAAMYYVVKLLGPEMAKPVPNQPKKVVAKTVSRDVPRTNEVSDESMGRVEKLESLLAEKNKNIVLLQTELRSFLAQIREFDKVKTLMEEEIHHLREQNRIFRAEFGLPSHAQGEKLQPSR